LRLEERGILKKILENTPNKSDKTPHYQIVTDLKVFSAILSDYGTGILEDIRSTSFGQGVIVAGLNVCLQEKLNFKHDLSRIAPADDIRMIRESASISTMALVVLLSNDIPLGYDDREGDHTYQMQLRIKHLGQIMHFATMFDLIKRPAAQLVSEDMKMRMSLASEIVIGSKTLNQKSDYDSEDIAGRQRALQGKQNIGR
jgi:hypothetical protein